MPGPIAVIDTDVLVPIVACDFLLTAFDYGHKPSTETCPPWPPLFARPEQAAPTTDH